MITYFCTDSHGNVYTRQSKHSAPVYTWAVLTRLDGTKYPVGKSEVSYSARRDLAISAGSSRAKQSNTYRAKLGRDQGYSVYDLMEVRAYPGRHKVEPKAAAPVADRAADAEAIFGTVEAVEAPAAPEAPLEPTKALYGELQIAYAYFNVELFKGRLPDCLMTLKCKPNSRGHYAHARFVAIGGTDKTDEIAMNPISLGTRSLKDSLSTLVHEMVHLEQQHFGTPGKGAHHNKEWGVFMKRQGLHPSSTSAPGGAETGNKMSHYIVAGGPFDCAADALISSGFKLSWADGGAYDRKAGSKQGKRVKYECLECGQACWARHDAKFICGECEIPMVEA